MSGGSKNALRPVGIRLKRHASGDKPRPSEED